MLMITCLVMIYHSLFCCLASSQHAKPKELKWAPPDLLLFSFLFCWLFMWCTSATNQQRGICKTLPDSWSSQGQLTPLLRNTLSDNQEMAALWALICFIFKPISQTITLYGTSIHAIVFPHETWFIVHIIWVLLLFQVLL